MKQILKVAALVLLLNVISLSASPTAYAQSTAQSSWLKNTRCVGSENDLVSDVPTLAGFECMFGNIISVALAILGLSAFAMTLYAGFQYLTAGEDAKKAEAAKSTLTLAITGLAAAFIGWFLLVVLSDFSGNKNLLQFNLGDTIESSSSESTSP